jgi:RNA polymerase sigma-70 factor (ECF subfamily)
MIGDAERAEDLVQETFVRVHRHLHRFDPTRKFSTWIYTIASNLAKNELRNRSRSPLVFTESARPPGDEVRPLEAVDWLNTPDRLYRHRRLYHLVRDVADRLPGHQREVFILRELEGKTYEEIARKTETNLGTVKSRLNRARTAFAEMIEPELE